MLDSSLEIPPHIRTGPGGLQPGRDTVLLVHGAGGSALSFTAQLRALDRQVNVAALDLPGHGAAPGPALESVPAMAGYVLDVARRLPSRRPPVLAGVSLGGATVLSAAASRPEACSGLIVMNVGLHPTVPRDWIRDLEADREQAAARIIPLMFAPGAARRLVEKSVAIVSRFAEGSFLQDLRIAAGSTLEHRLDHWRTPTLVLYGEDDQVVPPVESAALACRIPGAVIRGIPEAGHMMIVERPGATNRAILEFVAGLTGSPAGKV